MIEGVGKTFVTKRALEGLSYIDLDNTKTSFPESTAHLLLDDVEYEGELPRSQGSTIVVSKTFSQGCEQCVYTLRPRAVTRHAPQVPKLL